MHNCVVEESEIKNVFAGFNESLLHIIDFVGFVKAKVQFCRYWSRTKYLHKRIFELHLEALSGRIDLKGEFREESIIISISDGFVAINYYKGAFVA